MFAWRKPSGSNRRSLDLDRDFILNEHAKLQRRLGNYGVRYPRFDCVARSNGAAAYL
jgi:hypothetical protein